MELGAHIDFFQYGMTCMQCGEDLVDPELSECVSDPPVRPWRCPTCGFYSDILYNCDAKQKLRDEQMRKVFLSLLATS